MRNRGIFLIVLVAGLVVGGARLVQAEQQCPQWMAKIVSVEGAAESLFAHATDWQSAKTNDTFCADDRVRTLANSRAAIVLQNDAILRLDEKTTVKFSAVEPNKPTLLDLIKGSVFFLNRFPRALTINTPFVNASSEGTEFLITVDEGTGTTTVLVLEGRMRVENEVGREFVEGGQEAVAKAGDRPVVHLVVRPHGAISWSLYYPPVLNLREIGISETESLPDTDWRSKVRQSMTFYQQSDLAQAFSALEGVEDVSDARFYTYRASLRLAVGRVDEARTDIDKSLSLTPGNGQALALQAIIAVVQNEKDKALELAKKAVEAEPNSVTAQMALSYAYQASSNLAQALAAVKSAVQIDPKDALAHARLAELWMAQGYLDKALAEARSSAEINPRQSRAHTVLGFAYLTQIRPSEAKAAFEKAIVLDQADPQPRLGLGLAMIRQGHLAEGRGEIEIAVSLDPSNSLLRSYLGKAYYEEKRDGLVPIQLDMAKELDPSDPTPYLYDAIRKQTINRPVEAMEDLQESIKLNDNRAVYRSRMLLDNDLSSRSVSQGLIAEDLGFGQLALSEGWKSVNTDLTNYSAHRFLADSYAALPNSEIARQSALLKSQLLQPLNNNPVQPSLSDDSALSPGTGPVNPSFNEYTQLFDRNRVQLLASGIVGNHDTWGEEAVVSGLYDRYSLSLGQFRYRTQGFRENADLDQQIYDAFMQISLTSKLNIQGEVRMNDTKNGDLGMRFNPDLFSPTLDVDTQTKTYRLGLRYAATATSDFILSGFYQRREESQNDSTPAGFPPGIGLTTAATTKAHTVEGQYIFHTTPLSLIAGAGYYAGPDISDASIVLIDFDLTSCIFVSCPIENQVRHANLYLYSLINLPAQLTLSIGGSFDRFSSGQPSPLDLDQFNPKLGLTWSPTSSTTLRLAGFRSLRRSVVSNQTIEPTQVAGFQQFFEDSPGTDSTVYGIGVDQRFYSGLYGGIEFTKRDLTQPIFDQDTIDFTFSERDSGAQIKRGRAYLYWTPFTWIATSAEYYTDRSDEVDFFAHTVRTDRVPLGFKLYHPLGFFAKLKATYIDQKGEFRDSASGENEPGQSQFWILDAQMGYRFPKRFGILTIGAENLFDRRFNLYEIEPNIVTTQLPQYQPARFVFAKLTVEFN